MRLLNTHTQRLEELYGSRIPDYAILSHRWGENEVTFQEDREERYTSTKIDGCCRRAVRDGYSYVWIDTCCIDKRSSAELSEAINSMFAWYRDSAICYVYLEDVQSGLQGAMQYDSIRKSSWYGRGWTLQELLAPELVCFFDRTWQRIEMINKRSTDTTPFVGLLSEVTGIPSDFLRGKPLSTANVAEKMRWAANRETTRVEDMAYCLLGIFDVNMAMLYGEGERAFLRLQEEIMKSTDDQSLFAWGFEQPLLEVGVGRGFLANSPKAFSFCGDQTQIHTFSACWSGDPHYSLTNKGIHISLRYRVFAENLHTVPLVALNWRDTGLYDRKDQGVDRIMAMFIYGQDPSNTLYIRGTQCRPVLVSRKHFHHCEPKPIYISRNSEPSTLVIDPMSKAYSREVGIYSASPTLRLMSGLLAKDSRFKLVETYPPYVDWIFYNAEDNEDGLSPLIRVGPDQAELISRLDRWPKELLLRFKAGNIGSLLLSIYSPKGFRDVNNKMASPAHAVKIGIRFLEDKPGKLSLADLLMDEGSVDAPWPYQPLRQGWSDVLDLRGGYGLGVLRAHVRGPPDQDLDAGCIASLENL